MSPSSTLLRGHFGNIAPPSCFPLKRVGTVSTKDSSSTHGSSVAYSYFPTYNQDDAISGDSTMSYDSSTFASHHSRGAIKKTIDTEFTSLASERSVEKEMSQCGVEIDSDEDDSNEYDDQIIETNTKNRSLTLDWDRCRSDASSFRKVTNNNRAIGDEYVLPEGLSKSDIMVTIDIDDEARSSRAAELDEENLDVEILHRHRYQKSGEFSPRKQGHRRRRKFEEDVRQGIFDDLMSVYTATTKTAKLVLCVVVSVLSDGTLNHTFWSGGRVGLTEIVLQWVLFDVEDLQVYKRGRVVQTKDFGFGPLGLTENEGQQYLSESLAPRATNEIVSTIGNGAPHDLMVEV